MKKISRGLVRLLGEQVTLFCDTYIYTGKLADVDDDCVLLEGAKLVYDTGSLTSKAWTTAEAFSEPHYVMKAKIESFTKWHK